MMPTHTTDEARALVARLREQGWCLRQPGVLFGQAPLAPETPDAGEEQAATA